MTDGGQIKKLADSDRSVLLVRYLELADKTGDMGRVERAVEGLIGRTQTLPGHMFLRLLRMCRHLEDADFSAEVLASLFDRATVDEKLALECMNWASETLDLQHAKRVKDQILPLLPAPERDRFAISAGSLLEGPEAAYRAARKEFAFTTSPTDALQLAEAVTKTGRTRLSARFLRRSARRWPSDFAVKNSLFRAMLNCGDTERAKILLDDMSAYLTAQQFLMRQLDLLKAEGHNDKAWHLHKQLEREDAGYAKSFECLRMNVFYGDVEDFRTVAYEVFAKHRDHLRATFLGSVADEKRIYSAAKPPDASEAVTINDVSSYFHPASEIVRKLPQGLFDRGSSVAPNVARRVFQYWDTPDIPEMVGDIMQSWRAAPGWEYQCLTKNQALEWVQTVFDRQHARALRTSRYEAEQADFLRLCLLDAEGGLYADADDRLIGSVDGLLAGTRGAVFFTEAFGCLCNNVLYSPPGHVVISTAREMACEALLRRDNDKVWLKTGPGLITRALARCQLEGLLDDPDDPTKTVTILPNADLRRQVAPHIKLPYKYSEKNWARNKVFVPPTIKAVWDAIAAI